jgi:hypothetical protein
MARRTLAEANVARDWRIYAEFAQQLIPDGATGSTLNGPCARHWGGSVDLAKIVSHRCQPSCLGST